MNGDANHLEGRTKRVGVNAGNIIIESERTESDGGRKTEIAIEFSPSEWTEMVAAVNAAEQEKR